MLGQGDTFERSILGYDLWCLTKNELRDSVVDIIAKFPNH